MDPKRISMAHSLIVGYGIYKLLDVYQSKEAAKSELTMFHSDDYVSYLENFIAASKIDTLK